MELGRLVRRLAQNIVRETGEHFLGTDIKPGYKVMRRNFIENTPDDRTLEDDLERIRKLERGELAVRIYAPILIDCMGVYSLFSSQPATHWFVFSNSMRAGFRKLYEQNREYLLSDLMKVLPDASPQTWPKIEAQIPQFLDDELDIPPSAL